MSEVAIGKIVKAIGLNGEVKVISLTDFATKRFKSGKKVKLFNEEKNIVVETTFKSVRSHQQTYVIKFADFETVESVLPLMNCLILAERDLTLNKTSAYYYDDLVGCEVVNEESVKLGKVLKVEDHPAHQTLRVLSEGDKIFLVPFVNFFIKDVNLAKKIIIIHQIKGLL